MVKQLDVLDVIGNDAANISDFCGRMFWKWEERIKPLIEVAGYTDIGTWKTTARDSFGPLYREVIAVSPEGETVSLGYG